MNPWARGSVIRHRSTVPSVRLIDGSIRLSASDVSNFAACRHLTRLDLARTRGQASPSKAYDLGFQALVERGIGHERAVLQRFRDRGLDVADLETDEDHRRDGATATIDAIGDRVDVIYQGTLLSEDRLGLPDFLVRADLVSPGGNPELYEVVDAKLARSAKARALLQTAFYSRLLTSLQARAPRLMHLVLGDGSLESFRVDDFAAYERQVERMLDGFVSDDPGTYPPTDTYPEPTEHCAVCRWCFDCVARRRNDDDLSLVAGMTSRQRLLLKRDRLTTRRRLASLPIPPAHAKLGKASLWRAHRQAQLQVEREDTDGLPYELLEPERDDRGTPVTDRGLLALPAPIEGDLFFDIEGARFYSEDSGEIGLQYLFGIVDTAETDAEGRLAYHAIWAFDRAEEKRAFEEVVDFFAERLARNPDLHVYHYNHYEPTALDHLTELHETREEVLGRLMGRFAVREDEIDQMLRGRLFVDLYRVVRQGVLCGVESYSIKRLEDYYGFVRDVPLDEVTERMLGFEQALDEGTARGAIEAQQTIRGYNENDCRSTLELRGWLERLRAELVATLGFDPGRPAPPAFDEDARDPEVRRLWDDLMSDVPDEPVDRTTEQSARALMADLLEFHRRDAKPQWWAYFHRKSLTDEDLVGEQDAIAGLIFEADDGPITKQSNAFRYSFPLQEHRFVAGDSAEDPVSGLGWEIHDLDTAGGLLWLKRSSRRKDAPHPASLIERRPEFSQGLHARRVREFADRIIKLGDRAWPRSPAIDLLLRRRPNVQDAGAGPLASGDDATEEAVRLALALSSSCLPIQGPPGSGKTHVGAYQAAALVAAERKVGITAMSHAVVANLLQRIDEVARQSGHSIAIGQKPGAGGEWLASVVPDDLTATSNAVAADLLSSGRAHVLGGTTWLWASDELQESVDILIVDEAGQMPLADVLAVAGAADSVILLGDPQQLAQPSRGSHPPGAGASALEHVLDGATTMPDDRGLFIAHTRRLHPALCDFTSKVFYDDRLIGIPGLDRQAVLGDGSLAGSGFRLADVEHRGNTNSSEEEASVVADIVATLLRMRWRDLTGADHPLGTEDVLVVTPYNAQVRTIGERLREAGLDAVRVGTVDRFQGREAPVVIYSTATSSANEAPRGMEFLYDPHRLNVATSRGRAMVVLVSSPEVVEAACRTPRQLVLANAMCAAREHG
jgi:predicted RecB family nuclease